MGCMTGRERTAQQGPGADRGEPADLSGFPVRALETGTVLFRAHRGDRGPWWFSAAMTGRFDLPEPRGTCYLAERPLVAVRERLGVVLGGAAEVPSSLLEGVVVSRLVLASSRRLASLRSARAARFGVLRELETMMPYVVPQAWAAAFAAAGLGGVAYGARFTPERAGALAVFGEAGDAGCPGDPAPVPATSVRGAPGATGAPRWAELRIVPTPRRRPGRR
jgi:hypothetical protein